MSQILVISAHQDLQQSVSNQLILKELEQHFGNQISVRRLSDLYPDYQIDVPAEQAALVAADIVLLQYPTFWFNTPAILKKWLDDVWLYGFAYGEGGNKLHGKKLLVSTTTGSVEANYNGQIVATIDDLIKPVQHSALYAGLDWQGVYPLYGALYIQGVHDEAHLLAVQNHAQAHAQRLIEKLASLA
ncbi:NAD(P)H-dependent oxidoreductase [Alysiella filiformis]|uniref:NADPH-quinone reductase (Modulator of drug activity B) n=1 Tax=Alysiella filiformis DSM 16848 TaxID=1120981 RepID=A0A286ECZ9_9NEIS|nr:NAD(P)H-dependent oxidoreductase [Alysiella filiformis]QMT31917.1 NAD(P)H-dependent oxidoreductase [Alysiella filiformis]UBQ57176.1 NAD(P)H-dependent oxidoreductase [Alysiella filiformis DSM 16848]SOD68758.1 Putative NADPH-quinone reductase (modulator of drug activity B) [Alysiella filiformis DSM 16848]